MYLLFGEMGTPISGTMSPYGLLSPALILQPMAMMLKLCITLLPDLVSLSIKPHGYGFGYGLAKSTMIYHAISQHSFIRLR